MKKFITSALTLVLFICTICFLIINACRKIDHGLQSNKTAIANKFFELSPNLPGIVKKVATSIEKQNGQYNFLDKFVHEQGFALWNESVVLTKPNILTNRVDGAHDSLVFIPLVLDHGTTVHGYLACIVREDSVKIRLIDGSVYPAFEFSPKADSLTAEFVAASIMYFDRKVFHDSTFEITDLRLFDDDSIYKTIRFLSLKEDSSGGGTIIGERVLAIQHTVCINATIDPNLLPFRETVDIQMCWSYEEWVDIIDDNNPFTPVVTTGGGGGDWWNNNPCRALPGEDPCGSGGNTGWVPFNIAIDEADLTLNDIKNYKNTSATIASLETQAGITSSNFGTKVFLAESSETVPTPSSFKIYINRHLSIVIGMLAYAHELNNAINIAQIRTLMNNAYNNPKNSTNRTIYADGMADIEAQGIYTQIHVAYETGNQNSLTVSNTVVNAYVDYQNGTITLAAALIIMSNYIKSGDAKDESGNSIYQGYIDYYNSL